MNLPNQLTFARLFCVPVFMVFTYIDNVYTRLLALVIFILAGVTDLVDGHIARKYNLVTPLGVFLDPLADKLLVTAAFVSFVGLAEVHIPAWMVVLIVARDFFMTAFRSLAASQGEIIPADEGGKFKTSIQTAAIIATLVVLIVNSGLHHFWALSAPDLQEGGGAAAEAARILAWTPYWAVFVATIFSLVTGVSYLLKYRSVFQKTAA